MVDVDVERSHRGDWGHCRFANISVLTRACSGYRPIYTVNPLAVFLKAISGGYLESNMAASR